MTNKEFVRVTAIILSRNGNTITGNDLVDSLNTAGFRTTNGTQYVNHSRGIYKLIHATYDWLITQGQKPIADMVANAYTNAEGDPAWY